MRCAMKRDSRKTKTRIAKQDGPEQPAAAPVVTSNVAGVPERTHAAEKPFPQEVFVQHNYSGTMLVATETSEKMLRGHTCAPVADPACKRVGRYALISVVEFRVTPVTTAGLVGPITDARVECASPDVHVIEVTRATDRKFRASVRGDRKRKAGGKRKPRAERRGRR